MTTGAIRKASHQGAQFAWIKLHADTVDLARVAIVSIGQKYVVCRFDGYGNVRVPAEDVIDVS